MANNKEHKPRCLRVVPHPRANNTILNMDVIVSTEPKEGVCVIYSTYSHGGEVSLPQASVVYSTWHKMSSIRQERYLLSD